MKSAANIGRSIGLLLFVQLLGLSLPFILMMPIASSAYLENAAAISLRVRIAIFLLFANAALTIWIAIRLFPVFREYDLAASIWFLAFSIIWFVMQSVDNAHILAMLSLSQEYLTSGGANAELFGILGTALRSTRKWVHYTELLVIDTWFLLFYGIVFWFRLVPRLLAGFGLAAVLLHAGGIPLPVFLGYGSTMLLGYSLAISHVAIGAWLVLKGFNVKPTPPTSRI